MATFKHLSSKNADYGAAEKYLLFEHDEFTNKPVFDESGRLLPRENCRFATLNCGEDDFAIACMKSNLHYGKNRSQNDVKSHHYIISFDPRDGVENGLTVDRAHKFSANSFAANISQDIRQSFAHTPTVTTTRAISIAISLSIPCELQTYHFCRIWTDKPIQKPAASIVAPRQRWIISCPPTPPQSS